ncbi:hypothetical protein [cf. Phormidesmis sp. LEGE 11477]|uniref:hypothetical protein n=1 Tax=cf. Phormidesmis sp. LEGE 11477 TaxID=1828680 RepID=UPI0018816F2A|nr:hypothetical protein [cf. Phormidesmis sp. LEGE 11477]MBE9064662.1 hypothetical protein [cf. Phormidesmis sp. LEGE 11477]
MSLESIALIGILTLFTIVLGNDLFFLFIGRSLLETAALENFSTQAHWAITWRLSLVLFFLFLGAIAVNLTPNVRAEDYLLKIGLGSLLVYLVLFFISTVSAGDPLTGGYKTWMLLWPRAMAALVSFWSFLHYAMNPKI